MAAGDEATSEKGKIVNGNPLNPTLTLEILTIIREQQQQHGLRHGDFQRYRSYCSRRLRRLRKSLHFCSGSKHKYHFQYKSVTQDHLTDVRYLYIPLVTAERAWSYAMQLKQEANTEPRKKFHLMSRLHKASRLADQLNQLCESDKCDARTKLEAQGYAAWMQGSLKFELKEWAIAMDCFRKAQTIYEKLASALGADDKIIYQQRVDEITPNIRYCAYNIGDKSAIQDLKNMRRVVGEDFMAEKLDALIAQTREKQAATLSEVTWRGTVIPVKHEKVRAFLLSVQETETEMLQRSTDHKSKISAYESLLMECKDALQVLRDELHSDPNVRNRQAAGEGASTSVQKLYSYVLYIRLTKTVERNVLLVDSLKKHLGSEGKKKSKPQDLIRMYENIIQCLSEIEQLPEVASDDKFVEPITAQIVAYKAYRCYYIAQTFISQKKWVEAIAIFDRTSKYVKEAIAFGCLPGKLPQQLQELDRQIDGQKYSVHAFSILEKQDAAPSRSEKQAAEVTKDLVDRLDEYRTDASLTSKQPGITQFPPDFQAIPCKPLFFDLALNHVELPSLDDRLEQTKKGGGLTGMVKGWLWGGKK